MKELTREEIDKALDELRELRKDPEYKGFLDHHFAMCYSMSSMESVYDWRKLPEEYTCSICGKKFGEKNAIPIEYDLYFDKNRVGLPPMRISEREYDNMISVYRKVKDMGTTMMKN